jgi:hypothetical protein
LYVFVYMYLSFYRLKRCLSLCSRKFAKNPNSLYLKPHRERSSKTSSRWSELGGVNSAASDNKAHAMLLNHPEKIIGRF